MANETTNIFGYIAQRTDSDLLQQCSARIGTGQGIGCWRGDDQNLIASEYDRWPTQQVVSM
jgi:hypothetical protein